MKIGNRDQVAGFDCIPSHDPPPEEVCMDLPCVEWIRVRATPKQCFNDHAHVDNHYWWTGEEHVHVCPGRAYCDPRYMEPNP